MAAYERRRQQARAAARQQTASIPLITGAGRFDTETYDPVALEQHFKDVDLLPSLIDSTVKEMDEKASRTTQTTGTGTTALASSSSTSEVGAGEQLLQTMTEIGCEPIGGPLRDFKSLTSTELYSALLQMTSRTDSEDPRLMRTVTKGDTNQTASVPETLTRLPPPIGDTDKLTHVKEITLIQQHVFKATGTAPPVAIGVRCAWENGRKKLDAKGLTLKQINSKSYLRKAIWNVFVERDGTTLRRRSAWDLVFSLVHEPSQVNLLTLNEGEHVFVNLTRSEDTGIEFASVDEGLTTLQQRMDILRKENYRLRATLQNQIQELREQQTKLVANQLGKYGFTGALSGIADCYIDHVVKSGNATAYRACIEGVAAQNEFFKQLQMAGRPATPYEVGFALPAAGPVTYTGGPESKISVSPPTSGTSSSTAAFTTAGGLASEEEKKLRLQRELEEEKEKERARLAETGPESASGIRIVEPVEPAVPET